MASLYKRKTSPYWYIKYYQHGKQCYYNTKTKSKTEAQIILKTVINPIELNTRHKSNIFAVAVGLRDAMRDFRENVLILSEQGTKEKAPKSINRDQRNILNFEEYLEAKKITEYSEITEDTIRDYIQVHCIQEKQKKPNTVNKELRIVKKFFNWSVKKGYSQDNPAENLRNPKPSPKAPRFLSEEELERFWTASKEPYRTMTKILYLTGLRIGELLNVETQDIIRHTKQIIIRVKPGNKTKRETIIHCNKSAWKIIEELLSARDKKAPSTYLFYNGNSNKYDVNKVSDYIKKKLGDCNISDASVHTFRHTFASHLAIRNVSLYIISKLLRHKSIRETEIYAHLSTQSEREAVELLFV